MWKELYDFLISNTLLNSNFFIAAATILVGGAALYLYKKQRKDYIREAATVILTEIKRASEAIPRIRDSLQKAGFLDDDVEKIRISGWNNHKFSFVNLLSAEEWRALDGYYRNCSVYDEAVTTHISYFGEDVKHIYDSLHDHYKEEAEQYHKSKPQDEKFDADTVKRINTFSNLYIKNVVANIFYRPNKPYNDALKAITSLNEDILLSSVGVKLDKISKQQSLLDRLRPNK